MSLANKAGQAGFLMFFRKAWGALVNLGVMAYLARTLDKSDFGLVVITHSLIGFVQVLGVSGIGEYLIYYNGKDRKGVVNAAFWLNFVMTTAVVIAVLIIGPFWAESFNNPKIVHLTWMILVGFFASSLSSIPIGLFRKSMDFKPMITIQTIFGTVSQLTSVLFAYLGFGVYSLAIPNMLVIPIMSVVLFWRSGFRPSIKELNIKYWKNIFSYTKHVIGGSILTKFTNEGDTLVIGKLLGMEALGVYDIAFKLAHLLSTHLLPIVTTVSLPIFSQNQENKTVLKQHYLKMVHLISLIFIPTFGAMIVFAPELINLLYGVKWIQAIVPFQILCCFAIFRTMSSPASGLYGALGKPQYGLYFNLVFAPLFLLVIYLSSFYGLIWCCIFIMIARNAGSLFHFYLSNKLLSIPVVEFLQSFSPIFIATLVSMIVFGMVNFFVPSIYLLWGMAYFGLLLIIIYWAFPAYFKNSIYLIKSVLPAKKINIKFFSRNT